MGTINWTFAGKSAVMQMVPIFRCTDMKRAITFYTEILDFQLYEPGASADDVVVALQNGEAGLLLTILEGDQKIGIAANVLVSDVDSLFRKYTSRGLDQSHRIESPVHLGPVDQSWGNREFYVTDPDGNTLRFVQPMDYVNNAPNVQQAVTFFMVTNMSTSLDFYMKGLGFELKIKWEPGGTIEWCWLQLDKAALMLQEYRNNTPAGPFGTGVSVCFMCNDALKIYHDSTARGLSPKEPFVGNNLWVVEFNDPDGYQVVFESPTDVPEGTTYSAWSRNK